MRAEMLLALDAGSPVVSVAVGPPGEPVAERRVAIRQSSERLVALVDECLREAGLTMAELGGILALRGPGSFTGLRVGLATTLGFHQALGLPATAVPTHDVLALHGGRRSERARHGEPLRVAAVVDALRGEWFTRVFEVRPEEAPEPADDEGPRILTPAAVAALGPDVVCGFGVERLAEDPAWSRSERPPEWIEAESLAPEALRLAARKSIEWRPETLVAPLYLRPPAVSLPKRRGRRAVGPDRP